MDENAKLYLGVPVGLKIWNKF